MSDTEQLLQQIGDLKGKLTRAQRQMAGLKEKGKYQLMQYEDAKMRETHTNGLVMELLERQRELNVMLNRANIMLNRTQEAMALTSIEFNEMAKALPEPKKAEWSDRVTRINELFKKTGVQDAELVGVESASPAPVEPLDTSELREESEEAFGKKESFWKRKVVPQPPQVEAVLIEEAAEASQEPDAAAAKAADSEADSSDDGNGARFDPAEEDRLIFPPRRKSWWRRAAG